MAVRSIQTATAYQYRFTLPLVKQIRNEFGESKKEERQQPVRQLSPSAEMQTKLLAERTPNVTISANVFIHKNP